MRFSFLGAKGTEDADSFYKARRAFEVDPNQRFVDVKNRIGLRASCEYAQMYFSHQNRYKRYRRELDLHSHSSNSLNKNYDVLIVLPPRGALSQNLIQTMMRQSMGLAMSAGFGYVTHAQLNADRVLDGARYLQKLILEKRNAGRKLILISHSFGSAFVRVMLERSTSEDVDHIKGWANLSGLIYGSPLFHCSSKKSLFERNPAWRRTFSSEQSYFRGSLITHQVKVVHFLGMNNGESLSAHEKKAREQLKPWGPSDGVIPFAYYQPLEQTVVPLVDQGHCIDLSRLSMTFVRCLSSMVSTLPIPPLSIGQQLQNYQTSQKPR